METGSASSIDKTSFWWTGLCGICHPGRGPGEYNRDGDLYYDAVTGLMGYGTRGETDAEQEFDGDGKTRLFPDKLLLSTWWGDWDDVTGDGPSHDDTLNSIYLWKVRDIVSSGGLTANDDNGDGFPEVNTRVEIFAYLTAIQNSLDVHGNPFVADQAVLVKGGKVWFLDLANPGEVDDFEIHGSGVDTEASHPFSIDHNVLPLDQGVTLGGCQHCHKFYNSGIDAEVFDRKILLDAFDETAESAPGASDGAEPIYGALRDVSGVAPF